MDDFVVVLVEVDDYGLLNKPGPFDSGDSNNESRWTPTWFLSICSGEDLVSLSELFQMFL